MFKGIKLNSEAIILSPVSCRVFRWKKIAISGPSSHVKILFQKFKKKKNGRTVLTIILMSAGLKIHFFI